MTTYRIVRAGDSRSFPAPHAFVDQAEPNGASRVFVGSDAGKAFQEAGELGACPFVAVELGRHHHRGRLEVDPTAGAGESADVEAAVAQPVQVPEDRPSRHADFGGELIGCPVGLASKQLEEIVVTLLHGHDGNLADIGDKYWH